jgi:hypothetical protein
MYSTGTDRLPLTERNVVSKYISALRKPVGEFHNFGKETYRKILFPTTLHLLMCAFWTTIVLLLHTAVHNYQDVNLSFLHETKTSTKVEQISTYGYLDQFISAMSQVVALQFCSTQSEELIWIYWVCTVIA